MTNQSLTSILPVKIDPNLSAPIDVINVVYEDAGNELASYDVGDSEEVGEGSAAPPTGLYAPNYMNIVSQTAFISPEGNYLVDVVIDVEDIPGAEEYEVRLTKI
jgi:hypothetical protein